MTYYTVTLVIEAESISDAAGQVFHTALDIYAIEVHETPREEQW